MKALEEYKLIIWDMDGTLYHQPPFRRKMALVLVKGLLLRPRRWQEILILWNYRRLRERWDEKDVGEDLDLRQYEAVGKRCKVTKDRVRETVEYWMQQIPLSYLRDYRNEWAAKEILRLSEKGVRNVIYSDYPAADKAKALEIAVERCFCSGDPQIGCMKPNPRGILYILEELKVAPEEAVMIGDRYEKDGKAALSAGIDHMILGKAGAPASFGSGK